MFIYPLHEDPKQSVKYLTDFHIKKHVKSVTKLLLAHLVANESEIYDEVPAHLKFFKFEKEINKTEEWLNESMANVHWLLIYGTAMFDEYKFRFGKDYKYLKIWSELMSLVYGAAMKHYKDLIYEDHTSFLLTIPDMYVVYEEPVDCYRYFYVHARLSGDKSVKWTKGTPPDFLDQTKYTQEIDSFEGGTKLAKMVAKYKDSAVSAEEKDMILGFIQKEADKLRMPVERLIYDKFEKRKWHFFRWYTQLDSQLLTKLALHLFGDIPQYYGSHNKKVKEWKFKLTDIEAIKLREYYDFHRAKLWQEFKKVEDSMATAYAAAQGLDISENVDIDYANDDDDYKSKSTSFYDHATAAGLTMGMEKHTYTKTLGNK
ncbi:hypothetical protein MA9V1_206 [Chryseobacterium phage MA9V-1]|nr:hypothetical protein MA9V1_206 [Chryseobacterium phage MA9V-1]